MKTNDGCLAGFTPAVNTIECKCGCINCCGIKWLMNLPMDKSRWDAVMSLRQSYLTLALRFKDNQDFNQALMGLKFACFTYWTMPRVLESGFSCNDEESISDCNFWCTVWSSIGDVYMEYQLNKYREIGYVTCDSALKMCAEFGDISSKVHYNSYCGRSTSGKIATTSLADSQSDEDASKATEGSPTDTIDEYKQKEDFLRIFEVPIEGDAEYIFSAIKCCYELAKKVISSIPFSYVRLKDVPKKKAIACNELGRYKLAKRLLKDAEDSFKEAKKEFKASSDKMNIVAVYCNLAECRQTAAETKVAEVRHVETELERIQSTENKSTDSEAGIQTLTTAASILKEVAKAKSEFNRALRYYDQAVSEMWSFIVVDETFSHKVYKQVASAYKEYALFSGKYETEEHTTSEPSSSSSGQANPDNTWKAYNALQKALTYYGYSGDWMQVIDCQRELARWCKDICLKTINKTEDNTFSESAKKDASSAINFWKSSLQLCDPKKYPVLYLSIVMELTDFTFSMGSRFKLDELLESALLHLLEGRQVSGEVIPSKLEDDVWKKSNEIILCMLHSTKNEQQLTASTRAQKSEKLRKLMSTSLKHTDGLKQLHDMHEEWSN